MRRFVHGQGKQQNDEGDEDLREVDVQESLTKDGWLQALGRWRQAGLEPKPSREPKAQSEKP